MSSMRARQGDLRGIENKHRTCARAASLEQPGASRDSGVAWMGYIVNDNRDSQQRSAPMGNLFHVCVGNDFHIFYLCVEDDVQLFHAGVR